MDTYQVIEELEQQKAAIEQAIAALNGQPTRYKARRKAGKRKMSAEGRERISKAQKARWAAQKKK